MRVLAFNIQGCARGVDAVAGAIRDLAPDVACLTEVRGAHVRAIARLTQRQARFAPTIGFRRFGNAILTRHRAPLVERRRLSSSPGLERRGLLAVRVGDVVVACTHLGLVGEERRRHAVQILDVARRHPRLVLAGDLNEEPDGAAVGLLLSAFTDAFAIAGVGEPATFPAVAPERRIDYVLARGVSPIACKVPGVHVSDHLPVLADLA